MKPRIRIVRGIWHCFARWGGVVLCGLGYTPVDAYADWAHLIKSNTDAGAASSANT